MSPMRLLLEGPDLQTLLEQIRAKYGAEARILEAEKVRRGGVGGFFAHERFHIQVEVPDALAAPPATPASGQAVRSVMDLVDRLNRAEEDLHHDITGASSALEAAPTALEAAPTALEAAPTALEPARPSSALTAVDSRPNALRSVPVLDLGPAPREFVPPVLYPVPPLDHAPGGSEPAEGPAAQAVGGALAADPVPDPVPDPAPAAADPPAAPRRPVSTESATFADVLARLERSIRAREPAAAPAAVGEAGPAEQGAARPRTLAVEPSPATATTLRAPGADVLESAREMAARATRMGVPYYVLAGADDAADVYRRLLAWVQSRPVAPMVVSYPGQVIVVVGDTEAALSVAGKLASELGVSPFEINLAVSASMRRDVPVGKLVSMVSTGRLLSDVSDIAVRRSHWQQYAGSTIVVVEAGMPPADRRWLSEVVSALAPTFTWAVAQASTKVNDVTSWASGIGQVDALALVNVSATADPAAALAGPLPIGLLDGQRATVPRWMAMLTHEGERR